MTAPNEDNVNPFQPPMLDTTNSSAPALIEKHRTMIKTFREQIHALGAFWIFIGLIQIAGAAFLATADPNQGDNSRMAGIFLIAGPLSLLWISLGIFGCLKQMWAVYIGLAFSYLAIAFLAINLSYCPLAILIVVVMQAHRVISMAKKLTVARIPLTAKS